MISMRKKTLTLVTEDDLLIDLTLHKVPASLVTEFAESIVRSYYKGDLNAAFQDLMNKALAEQEFVLSRITHIRNVGDQQPHVDSSK